MPDPPTKEELIALRGSTDESIAAIDKKIEELQKKIEADPPPADPPPPETPQASDELKKFQEEKAKFLKDKQDFESLRKESLLEPFSKEERVAYKDLSISELTLITTDRKNRKDGLFLTEPPPSPDPQDKVAIGWGQTSQGYGWYNAKGEILSQDRASPYGVPK